MIFREVLRPPIWVLAFIYFLFLSIVLSIWAAFDNLATLITLLGSTIALLIIAQNMRTVITISQDQLSIDKAHIEIKYLGEITLLNKDMMRLLRTRDADPAAFLAIKFWEPKGVKIDLKDPRDKTPYWLITSKRGEEIAAFLKERKS